MTAENPCETRSNTDANVNDDFEREKKLRYLRKRAIKFKFHPFFNLEVRAVNFIRLNYADWVWPVMAEKLRDPEALFSRFAIHFIATMEVLGPEACSSATDLYRFVTTSPEFEKNRGVRTVFNRADRKLRREEFLKRQALSTPVVESKKIEMPKIKAVTKQPVEMSVSAEPKRRRIAPIKPPPGWRGK